MDAKVTVPALQRMKREGRKIVGVVAWDYQIAQVADRAGVDLISVGDTVGVNLWGQANPLEVTMEQMVLVCQAVRRGVRRALVSCDFPYGPLQEGGRSAVRAAIRLVKEAGADLVKLDGAEAASVIGERCGHLGIQTTGLVFGQGRAASVISVLRRHVRVLVVSGDEDDVPELLTALRA